jgi:hypothetical protein
MVMDKGLSKAEAEDLVSVGAPHIDIVKLGFELPLLHLTSGKNRGLPKGRIRYILVVLFSKLSSYATSLMST